MSKKMLKKISSFEWSITSFSAHLRASKGYHFKNSCIITISDVARVVPKLLHSTKGQRALVHDIAIGELFRLFRAVRKCLHPRERQGALTNSDHEFSFDESPVIHMKSCASSTLCFKTPNIPCFKPCTDFEHGDENIDEKAEQFIRKFYEEMKQQNKT